MKKILICLLLAMPLLVGCNEKKQADVLDEPIAPTGREREILAAYKLTADTERGQKKLRKMRERQAKLEAAQQRMAEWAEEAEKRKAEEEGL